MIKVFIIDDSALVRQTIKDILSSDSEIEVIGTAPDPVFAISKLKKRLPDVIILDIQMPRMDGLTFLKKIMQENPIPVVICSSYTLENSKEIVNAFKYGAVEVITKPKIGTKQFLEESKIRLTDAVKAASIAEIKKLRSFAGTAVAPKLTSDAVLSAPTGREKNCSSAPVIVIGASTGGTEALKLFLGSLPRNIPGIVVVQHMPEHFTTSFAEQLDSLCSVRVKEAVNYDPVQTGLVLIAPGNKHILLKRHNKAYFVEVKYGPLVNRHRPSVDVLFRSAARYAGSNAVGVIMTGMGDDGARGMMEMKKAGAFTIAQDKTTSIVFGMPGEAIKRGAVDKIAVLQDISDAVIEAVQNRQILNK